MKSAGFLLRRSWTNRPLHRAIFCSSDYSRGLSIGPRAQLAAGLGINQLRAVSMPVDVERIDTEMVQSVN